MALELKKKTYIPNNETKWIDLDNYDDVRFLIRPAGTVDYTHAYAKYDKWLQQQEALHSNGTDCDLDIHEYDERKLPLQAKIIAKYVVQDWESVVVEGEDIPFTIENCVELFTNQPDVMHMVHTAAKQYSVELYLEALDVKKKP